MTVRIFNSEMVVEASAKKDPRDYVWFRITKGKVLLDSLHKEFEVELSRGEKFGLHATKTAVYLLDEDNFDVHFKLKPADVSALMANAAGFSGEIDGMRVVAGDPNVPPGMGASSMIEQAQHILTNINKMEIKARRAGYEISAKDKKALSRLAFHSGLYLAQQSVRLKAAHLEAMTAFGVEVAGARVPKRLIINPDDLDDVIANISEGLIAHRDGKKGSPKGPVSPKQNSVKLGPKANEQLAILESNIQIVRAEMKKGFNPNKAKDPSVNGAQMKALKAANRAVLTLQKLGMPLTGATKRFVTTFALGESPSAIMGRLRNVKDGIPFSRTYPTKKAPKGAKHPGLEIPQGAVPKQDKQSQSAKQVTDKNVVSFLTKLGVVNLNEPTNRSNGIKFAGHLKLTAKTIKDVKAAFNSAGWKVDYLKTGKSRAVTDAMRFSLTGARYDVLVTTQGASKGRVVVAAGNTYA